MNDKIYRLDMVGPQKREILLFQLYIIYIYFHNIKQLSFYCMDNILAITIHDRWNLRHQISESSTVK